MPPQQFASAGRRSGARIQQRDVEFAPGEGLIENGQITDHDREEAQTDPRFENRDDSAEPIYRNDITESQSEERRAAEIEIGEEIAALAFNFQRCSDGT